MQLHQKYTLRKRAFSLIEMLVVIAVIGIIAAIAIPSVSDVNGAAKTARDQRNAQNLCSMYNGALVAGVDFTSNTTEGILDELIAGKTGNTGGITFQYSPLNDEAREGLIAYCSLDETGNMRYSSEPVEESVEPVEPEPDHQWQHWFQTENHTVEGTLAHWRAQDPNTEFRAVPLYPGWSAIQRRPK